MRKSPLILFVLVLLVIFFALFFDTHVVYEIVNPNKVNDEIRTAYGYLRNDLLAIDVVQCDWYGKMNGE
jgi:hypothetical protein